jgi:NAD(P)-dependent dehydrogenase (short-subunit alcohol dehydrogenase family)
MRGIEGKVALVTGASRQIGAAVAHALGQRGAAVVVNYLSGEDRAKDVAASIVSAGGRAIFQRADVRNREDVRLMIERTIETFGGLDILVNNARQIHPKKSFLETNWEEDMLSQMAVHLGGAFHCCQEAIPRMIGRGGGAIVNMLSTAFRNADGRLYAYGPAKAALRNFTMNLAVEFRPSGIRVNSVAPGNTSSPGFIGRHRSPAEVEGLRQKAPLRRIAAPEDVAEAVVFLCSDASRHITELIFRRMGGRF